MSVPSQIGKQKKTVDLCGVEQSKIRAFSATFIASNILNSIAEWPMHHLINEVG
jgi:hypothetical protein